MKQKKRFRSGRLFKNSLVPGFGLRAVIAVLLCCATAGAEPKSGVPQGYYIIEGDILVRDDPDRGVYDTHFWTNGIVPYEFDANVNAANQTIAESAMAEWEDVSAVNFVPRSGQTNYIHIRNSTENSSMVGMVGGEQFINIFNWGTFYTVVHEFGHALGLWHEQSRSDRDTYINIVTNRIQDGLEHNFDKHDTADVYGPYDFDSVMHYGQCAFSCCDLTVDPCCTPPCSCWGDTLNCRTIIVRPPWSADWQDAIGQRNHLSSIDAATMGVMYPEDNWVFVDGDYTGSVENGSYAHPYKTVDSAVTESTADGTLKIQPGTYNGSGYFDTSMTFDAPVGEVLIGKSMTDRESYSD